MFSLSPEILFYDLKRLICLNFSTIGYPKFQFFLLFTVTYD